MFSSDNLMFGTLIAVLIGLVVFYIYTKDKTIEPMLEMDKQIPKVTKDMTESELKSLVNELYNKIKYMKEEDSRLKEKLSALHFEAGIQREQTKYLTANVNKTVVP